LEAIEVYEREKHYTNLIVAITAGYGTLLNAYYLAIDAGDEYKLLLAAGTVILPVVILLLGRDLLLGFLLKKLSRLKDESLMIGTWDIIIEFKDDEASGQPKRRSGHFTVEKGVVGYRIVGHRLYDHGQNVTMEGWKTADIDIVRKDGALILSYLYQTFEGDDNVPDKIGLVVAARSPKEAVFSGVFHDISASDRGRLRRGTVTLIPEGRQQGG
jgi:hypothetical protein